MEAKIKINQAVLVEGRYDKIRLDSLLDALIIPVHGFSIFTDLELRDFIKKLAAERGIITLMDSDSAGFKIRGFISGLVPTHQITHVYIPDIFGKEKRKKIRSKEGTLGVEGMDTRTLKKVFADAGILGETSAPNATIDIITKQDFILLGLSGSANSSALRGKLYKELSLPAKLSANSAVKIIGGMLSRAELASLLDKLSD